MLKMPKNNVKLFKNRTKTKFKFSKQTAFQHKKY